MTHAVQGKTKVRVTETKSSTLKFFIPEDLLPAGYQRLTIFRGDNLNELLPGGECPVLHNLCAGLMPDERCGQVDHIRIARFNKSRTRFEVQLTTELVSTRARGRIDAALRACGFDPII